MFVATFLLTFRIVLRTRKLRYFHSLASSILLLSGTIETLGFFFNFDLFFLWQRNEENLDASNTCIIHVYIWIVVGGWIIIVMRIIKNLVIEVINV